MSGESRRVVYEAAGGILAVSLLSLAVPVGARSVVGLGAQSLLLVAYLLRVGRVPWQVDPPKRWPLLAAARDGLTLLLAIRLLQEFVPSDPEVWVGWASIFLGLAGVGLAVIRSLLDEDLSGARSASLLAVASLPLLAWGSLGHAAAGLGVPAYLLVVFPVLARIQVSGMEERVWIGLLCLASVPWVTAPAGTERVPLLIAGNILLQTCLWYAAIRYALSPSTERPAMVGLEPTLDRLSLAAPLTIVLAFGGATAVILGELPHSTSLGGAAAAVILTWVSSRTAGRARRRWQRVVAAVAPPAGPDVDAALGAAARSAFGGLAGLLEGDGALLWLAVGLLYAGLAASSLLAG